MHVFWREKHGVLMLPGCSSLRNHDGDAEDNVDQKVNLCFTYESRGTLKSFTFFTDDCQSYHKNGSGTQR